MSSEASGIGSGLDLGLGNSGVRSGGDGGGNLPRPCYPRLSLAAKQCQA